MSRSKTLLAKASRLKCSNLVAFEPENIFYMTGFWGEAIALLNDSGLGIIAPKLEAGRARKEGRGHVIESERGADMLESLFRALGDGKTCTDCSDHPTVERLRKMMGSRLVQSKEPFYQARQVKDSSEIAVIGRASRILDRLFGVCERRIRAGMTERELQAVLLYEGMKLGAYPPAYRFTLAPLIIASGTNSSLPHAEPTDRKIRKGDLVTADLTLRYDGYIADATRTFGIGSLSSEQKKIYGIVKDAQENGIDAVRSGTECGTVDDACRSFIRDHDYGKYFIHSTGHGIGLEVHEPPWLRMKSRDVLQNGMAVTVEPGIYIPSKYGVRIEDSVVVAKRAKILNRYTKDLVII